MNAKTLLHYITENEDIEQIFLNFDSQFIKQTKRIGCDVIGTPESSLHAELEIMVHSNTFLTAKEYHNSILKYVNELTKFFKSQSISVENNLMTMDRIELTIEPSQKLRRQISEGGDLLGVVILAPLKDTSSFRIFIWRPSLRHRHLWWTNNPDKVNTVKQFVKESLMGLETLLKAIRLVEYE